MRFTPYMSECCDVLLAAGEYETDRRLVELVKLQCILQKIRAVTTPEGIFESQPLKPPLIMYIKQLDSELKKFKEELPSNLKDREYPDEDVYQY
jgi:hypothetical protein